MLILGVRVDLTTAGKEGSLGGPSGEFLTSRYGGHTLPDLVAIDLAGTAPLLLSRAIKEDERRRELHVVFLHQYFALVTLDVHAPDNQLSAQTLLEPVYHGF